MSQSNVKLFEKEEFGKVRVVIRNGNPWFGAKDVATALGYADTDDAVRRHCNYAELFKPGELPGLEIGPRGMYFIPEPDVYRLVVRSALPTAKVFEKWVFEEVLPSIRKTGQYGGIPDFTDPVAAARAWAGVEIMVDKPGDICHCAFVPLTRDIQRLSL